MLIGLIMVIGLIINHKKDLTKTHKLKTRIQKRKTKTK